MKLISMTDFVLRLNQNKTYVDENGNMPFYNTAINHYQNSNRSEDYRCVVRYANFLKQPLNLEMFVPCDVEGNILGEPIRGFEESDKDYLEFVKSKERVLFKDFYLSNGNKNVCTKTSTGRELTLNSKYTKYTINYLVKYNLELSESAIKQLGLCE